MRADRTRSKGVPALPFLLLAIPVLSGCTGPSSGPAPTLGILVGSIAPDFAIVDIDGEELRLRDLRGQAVLLDLMGVNCPPCREEMPHLLRTAAAFGGGRGEENVTMVSVDMGAVYPAIGARSDQEIREFRDEFRATWRFARDTPEAGVGAAYRPIGFPALLVIGGDGIIAYRKDGAIQNADGIIRALEDARG